MDTAPPAPQLPHPAQHLACSDSLPFWVGNMFYPLFYAFCVFLRLLFETRQWILNKKCAPKAAVTQPAHETEEDPGNSPACIWVPGDTPSLLSREEGESRSLWSSAQRLPSPADPLQIRSNGGTKPG